jgi:hypothetical protein
LPEKISDPVGAISMNDDEIRNQILYIIVRNWYNFFDFDDDSEDLDDYD